MRETRIALVIETIEWIQKFSNRKLRKKESKITKLYSMVNQYLLLIIITK